MPTGEVNNLLLLPLYVLVVVVAGFSSLLLARWLYGRQRAGERPEGHDAAAFPRRSEARDRWRTIDRAQLHEINRTEVDRLLAAVDAGGAASLRADERRFLDYLVELTGGAGAALDHDPAEAAADARRGADGGSTGSRTVADPRSGEA